ncbi:hypothetical protein [Phyllobacterium zundukense]|uniref:Glycoside hydrolase family 65 N-terminal domain-containing protein n=1 Tax=Phyllobacterium zundukense TaxID=1867719 RepID=A0A2N9W1G7_9HYPH|nr:hypothetical protein [Phyllobacterium zundukense]ATU91642.1 hypothetical protein BLM14_08375 [Phyllobacterium zundukense]PIO45585.1 hypothetical protein B5P45_06150 [Phyllobacterium zundukense]
MIFRTTFVVGLIGCAVLAGCNGSGSDSKTEQTPGSTFTQQATSDAATIARLTGELNNLRDTSTKELQVQQDTITGLKALLDGLPANTKVSDIVAANTELKDRLKGLDQNKTVGDLLKELAGLQQQLNDLPGGSSVKDLTDGVKKLAALIEGLAESSTLDETISALQESLKGLPKDKKVSDLIADIDRLSALTKDLPKDPTVADLDAKLKKMGDDLKNALTALNALLSDKPDPQTETDIQNAITQLGRIINKLREDNKLALQRIAELQPSIDPAKAPAPPKDNLDSWVIVNRDFNETFTHQPFVSNGYIGMRIPAAGQGYWLGSSDPDNIGMWPWYPDASRNARFTSSMVEGFYARDNVHMATLPTWTSLTIRDDNDGAFFDPRFLDRSKVSDYKQTVDVRKGLVTTSLVWTSPNDNGDKVRKKVRLTWTAFAHRTKQHLGVIRLDITPLNWTGNISVRSFLDLNGIRLASRIESQKWEDASGLGAQASITADNTRFKATTAFKMEIRLLPALPMPGTTPT